MTTYEMEDLQEKHEDVQNDPPSHSAAAPQDSTLQIWSMAVAAGLVYSILLAMLDT